MEEAVRTFQEGSKAKNVFHTKKAIFSSMNINFDNIREILHSTGTILQQCVGERIRKDFEDQLTRNDNKRTKNYVSYNAYSFQGSFP